MDKSLFIVGMPRSGTKLFRDLCNQNSLVSIPEIETHFFPLLIQKFGYKLSNSNLTYEALLSFIKSTTFYYHMNKVGYTLLLSDLEENVDLSDWASIIKYILVHFSPKGKKNFEYFGDKTPNYIYNLKLIKSIFPDAKFIVLIRDPRDYALSMKRTWNKSLYRAAFKWRIVMLKLLEDISEFRDDVHFVKYEDILTDTKQVMLDFCQFVGIPFQEEMLKLSKPTEMVGKTKGKTFIVRSNFNKYKEELSMVQIQKIEELSFDALVKWYSPEYASGYHGMNCISQNVYKTLDGYASWYHHVKEKNLIKGTWYFFNLHKEKGYRSME